MLLTIVHGLLQLLVALIPLAIWQRTQISGFLLVAASLVLETLLGWSGFLVFDGMDPARVEKMLVFWRLLGFAVLGLGAFGFWQVYNTLKQRWPTVQAR